MKHIMIYASKILFYVLALAIFIWTASLTLSFISRAMPGAVLEPYFALAVFDIGALAWLAVFLGYARGIGQRSIAILLMCLDLIGIGLMSFAELILGGQAFFLPPEDLGTVAIWAIGIWTFLNLAGIYAFHLLDPETQESITAKTAEDKIIAKSLRLLELKTDAIADELADQLGEEMKNKVLLSLGLGERLFLTGGDDKYANPSEEDKKDPTSLLLQSNHIPSNGNGRPKTNPASARPGSYL